MNPVINEINYNKRPTTDILLNNIVVSDIITISNIITYVDGVVGFCAVIYLKTLQSRI